MLGSGDGDEAPKLYVLPGSHPCAAVEAALRLKGIEFKRVDLLPSIQMLAGPLLYGGTTVPGMRLDGEKLVGSRTIMRRLDELRARSAPAAAVGGSRTTRACWRPSAGATRYCRAFRAGSSTSHSYAVPRRWRATREMPSCRFPRPLLRPTMPLDGPH